MLFLESKTDNEIKEWTRSVLENLSQVYSVSKLTDLDTVMGLTRGTCSSISSKGTVKRVMDMAITTAIQHNLSLDELLLNRQKMTETPDITPALENGLFKAHDAGIISVDYPCISVAAQIILDEICLVSDVKKAS